MSFLRAWVRSLLHAATPHCFEINRRRQRNQTFVRADVRSSFLAANVLLARRQSQDETAPALLVVSFANQAAGNLSCVLIASRKQTDIRSAEGKRHAERL